MAIVHVQVDCTVSLLGSATHRGLLAVETLDFGAIVTKKLTSCAGIQYGPHVDVGWVDVDCS